VSSSGFLPFGGKHRGHVVLHHGELLKLVPDGVHMVRAGHLEELLKVIGGLPSQALEVTLSGSGVFFVGAVGLLVIVIVVAASSNGDPLGALVWPPLMAFGTPLHSFADDLGQCPSAVGRGRLPLVLDENSTDGLLTRGVSGGDIEKLFCGLWLITTELMY
jgi:hypothetical protein